MSIAIIKRMPVIVNARKLIHRIGFTPFSFNTQKAPILNLTARALSTDNRRKSFFWRFKTQNVENLKLSDGIPTDYVLIYRNAMHRYIWSAQIVSFASAFVIAVAVILNDYEASELNTENWLGNVPPPTMENEGMVFVTIATAVCIILQIMVSKMPVRIYNLPAKQKYVFVFLGNLPNTKKKIVCQVKDVIKMEESGVLPWKDSRYEIVNRRRIIMLENFFRRPADLHIMLGYQKAPENYD